MVRYLTSTNLAIAAGLVVVALVVLAAVSVYLLCRARYDRREIRCLLDRLRVTEEISRVFDRNLLSAFDRLLTVEKYATSLDARIAEIQYPESKPSEDGRISTLESQVSHLAEKSIPTLVHRIINLEERPIPRCQGDPADACGTGSDAPRPVTLAEVQEATRLMWPGVVTAEPAELMRSIAQAGAMSADAVLAAEAMDCSSAETAFKLKQLKNLRTTVASHTERIHELERRVSCLMVRRDIEKLPDTPEDGPTAEPAFTDFRIFGDVGSHTLRLVFRGLTEQELDGVPGGDAFKIRGEIGGSSINLTFRGLNPARLLEALG